MHKPAIRTWQRLSQQPKTKAKIDDNGQQKWAGDVMKI